MCVNLVDLQSLAREAEAPWLSPSHRKGEAEKQPGRQSRKLSQASRCLLGHRERSPPAQAPQRPPFPPRCVAVGVPPGFTYPSSSPQHHIHTVVSLSPPDPQKLPPKRRLQRGSPGLTPPARFSSPRTPHRGPEALPFGPPHGHQVALFQEKDRPRPICLFSLRLRGQPGPAPPGAGHHGPARDWGSGSSILPP